MYLKVKSGIILSTNISISANDGAASEEVKAIDYLLTNKNICEIDDFEKVLGSVSVGTSAEVTGVATWLNQMFGK